MDTIGRRTYAKADGRPPRASLGFTLIELIIVMVVIGIIVGLILVASQNSIRQAEMKATQALILKLESGYNDRMDALMRYRPEANFSHAYMAGIYPGGSLSYGDMGPLMVPPVFLPPTPSGAYYPDPAVRNSGRARAIALADYMKSEMPDVFTVVAGATTGSGVDYPLNFAALLFPGTGVRGVAHDNYVLPMGHMIVGPRTSSSGTETTWVTGYGDSHFRVNPFVGGSTFESTHPQYGVAGTGIYGASYAVAAGLYKNLGYQPRGYDLVDNDGDGLIDEWDEGVPTGSATAVQNRLKAHTHDTARAEMLYAILVEGQGPLGSVFNADDFSDREVKDTDGDGLPEFVDAWGKPLQFFRWPTLYHSDTQRGQNIQNDPGDPTSPVAFVRPYASVFDGREQDPLDPNGQLRTPSWWFGSVNANYPFALGLPLTGLGASTAVSLFEYYFYRITEPLEHTGADASGSTDTTNLTRYWDRSLATGYGYRRAFYTKPLILSGGPDGTPGVFQTDLTAALPTGFSSLPQFLIQYENSAPSFDPTEAFGTARYIPSTNFALPGTNNSKSQVIFDAGRDDVTNHNVISTAGF